jgi:hypothetical protein
MGSIDHRTLHEFVAERGVVIVLIDAENLNNSPVTAAD